MLCLMTAGGGSLNDRTAPCARVCVIGHLQRRSLFSLGCTCMKMRCRHRGVRRCRPLCASSCFSEFDPRLMWNALAGAISWFSRSRGEGSTADASAGHFCAGFAGGVDGVARLDGLETGEESERFWFKSNSMCHDCPVGSLVPDVSATPLS